MKIDWQTLTSAMRGRLIGNPALDYCGVSTDSRRIEQGQLYFALTGERFDGHLFAQSAIDGQAAAVVVKRGRCGDITPRIEVDDPLEALQKLGGFIRSQVSVPVIAITGSHGKTTTKDMLASIMNQHSPGTLSTYQNLNGLIGVPLTLSKITSETPAVVIEVGISKPGEMARLAPLVKPTLSIFTCAALAHVEYLSSLQQIVHEKSNLLLNTDPQGHVLLNADDPAISNGHFHPNTVTFGLQTGDYQGTVLDQDNQKTVINISDPNDEIYAVSVPLTGEHNVLNAVAAVAAARIQGVSFQAIQDGLTATVVSPHRSNVIECKGIVIIDDTYNAAPQSMKMALKSLSEAACSGRRVAVLGDMLELGDYSEQAHRELGEYLNQITPDNVITFGSEIEVTHSNLSNAIQMKHHHPDTDKIAAALFKYLKPGDIVLVKASRSMRGELVVAELKKLLS